MRHLRHAEHFTESYGKKARFFAYNSRQLHHLESFSSDAGINVMVINIQAFNATGKDNRRIYDELDDFQSRRPIDVISSNRPILILDEPQKMEGKKTLEALAKFKPLMILRYSATHRTTHNKIHRLDALDAYNQKLVKKIAVRGIAVKGLAGTNAYLYLESIEISRKAPVARIEMEVRQGGGIKRIVKRLERGKDLFIESNELDQYRGFVIAQIDANKDTVEFTNGHVLSAGDATGDITEMAIRRIQIREAIRAHLEKEQVLFAQGIKVLSLFFIDEVAMFDDIINCALEKSWHRGSMKALTITDAEDMIMAIQDEIRRTEDARYNHRLHAMLLVAQGQSCREVGRILGDAPRTVAYWVNRFENEGFAGLVDGERPGRPCRLNKVQLAAIETALRKDPAEFGLQGLWDGKTLSCFIQDQWGISLGVRQCQRLFRQLGFRLRKPRPKIAHADPAQQAEYKKTAEIPEE